MRPSPRLSKAVPLILLVAAFASACARRAKPDEPATPSGLAPGIYDVDSGEKLDEADALERIAAFDYVVVGERHDIGWHHELQKQILESVAEARQRRVALGMEMFKRPFQQPLDAYIAGDIDEEQMLEETEWKQRWGMDTELYRPLWTTARRLGAPIAALNVPRSVTRQIARVGLAGLPAELRQTLPADIDTSNKQQRAYLEMAFGKHADTGEMNIDYFVEAQATWDETMAQTAIDFVRTREAVDAMVIVAGRAHARRSFGIPARLIRRLGDAEAKRVISVIPFEAGAEQPFGPLTLERLREADVADVVWVK